MITRPLGKQDYDHIVQIIDRWWGGPTTALAHPIFFYELGAMARVVEHDGILVGFLLGFVAPGPPKPAMCTWSAFTRITGAAAWARSFIRPSKRTRVRQAAPD
jgi:hypothetical protein